MIAPAPSSRPTRGDRFTKPNSTLTLPCDKGSIELILLDSIEAMTLQKQPAA
ncbi:MAG: hypothetical protein ACREIA_07375 [Opitutaceae bacterium]